MSLSTEAKMKVKMTQGKGFVQIYCELTTRKWRAGTQTELACQSHGEREKSEILHALTSSRIIHFFLLVTHARIFWSFFTM